MIDLKKDMYVYLLVIRTLGVDKTTLTYDVTPFKTLDAVNDAVLDSITNMAKVNRDEINYISYIPRDNTKIFEHGNTQCGRIVFKSNVEVIYKILLRKIKEVK